MKYRKRPVTIDAFKWTGGSEQAEDPVWIIEAIKAGTVRFVCEGHPGCFMLIDTLEDMLIAKQGDYIIRGIKGELYPCEPDIFEQTYEII